MTKFRRKSLSSFLFVSITLVFTQAILMANQALAQTFTTIYAFAGNGDGEYTSDNGGDFSCNAAGCGTVFKLSGASR
jgi:hypothetical protein